MEPDDSSLWLRSCDGDADAFGVVFERHATAIYNYCYRRVGNWAVAEDLLSIVFLEAWRRRDKAIETGKALPWLYGIATNVVRNQWRSERRYSSALRRLPRPRPEADLAAESAGSGEAAAAVALIKRLPRREQEVFVLCAWSQLSYEEAAIALNIPVGTVRSRLSRARARLRELKPALGHSETEEAQTEEPR
jgi:RNA polymerase sigma-70 factor (ECF subfamily)